CSVLVFLVYIASFHPPFFYIPPVAFPIYTLSLHDALPISSSVISGSKFTTVTSHSSELNVVPIGAGFSTDVSSPEWVSLGSSGALLCSDGGVSPSLLNRSAKAFS